MEKFKFIQKTLWSLLLLAGSVLSLTAQDLDVDQLMKSKNLTSVYLSKAMLSQAADYLGDDFDDLGIDLSQARGVYIFQSDGNEEGARLLRSIYSPISKGSWKNYQRMGKVKHRGENMYLYGKRYGDKYSSLHYLSDIGRNVTGIIVMGNYTRMQIENLLNPPVFNGKPYKRGKGYAYGHANKHNKQIYKDIRMTRKQIDRELRQLERDLKRADRSLKRAISRAEKQAAKARRDAIKARREMLKMYRKRMRSYDD